MSAAEVLIVEDDEAIAAGLARVLEGSGHRPQRVGRGRAALQRVSADTRLVILDLGLPDLDGVEVCRRLRADWPLLPILILSARDLEIDVVAGLDAGADDYLVKPFRLSELMARVRAHLRRDRLAAAEAGDRPAPAPLHVGRLRVDVAARRAYADGRELELRPKEFDLLARLAADAGRAVTRAELMHDVWDTEWLGSTKTLDTHVLTLRAKVGEPDPITTLRGVGYRLDPT